jgi:hypothetical protein
MSIDSEPVRWTILTVVNIPVYLGLGSLFFGDWSGFWDCLRFWFTPDWISLFNGEYFEDRWSEAKLFLFAIICFAVLYGEYRAFFGDPLQPQSPTHRADQSLSPDATSSN